MTTTRASFRFRGTSESDRDGILSSMVSARSRALIRSVDFLSQAQGPLTLAFEGVQFDTVQSLKSFLQISDLGPSDLQLVTPFEAEWEFSEGHIVVSHAETEIFGYGRDLEGAIADFKAAAVELYERLSANEGQLGPALVPVLSDLRRRIRHV